MSLDEIMAAADRLNPIDLDQLLQQVSLLRARRTANLLSPQESQLLQQINQDLPDELDRQSKILREACKIATATQADYDAFSIVNDQIERFAAKRVEALIQLSELRQVPFIQLVNELGIHAPSDD